MDALEQTRELSVIFDTRLRLDAAGDVDGVRPDQADACADVVGRDSAGEKKRLASLVLREQRPVEAASRSARAPLVVGIEQQPGGIRRAVRVGQRVADAQRLDDGKAD